MSRCVAQQFWLFKTEPSSFGIADLQASLGGVSRWDGVRNYQARNLLRDSIHAGDGVLIYHSCTKPLAVVGTAQVVGKSYPDPSQFDPESRYFDGGAAPSEPRWWCVDVAWQSTFKKPVRRDALAKHPACRDLMLLQKGSRLSVQPVPRRAWELILELAQG